MAPRVVGPAGAWSEWDYERDERNNEAETQFVSAGFHFFAAHAPIRRDYLSPPPLIDWAHGVGPSDTLAGRPTQEGRHKERRRTRMSSPGAGEFQLWPWRRVGGQKWHFAQAHVGSLHHRRQMQMSAVCNDRFGSRQCTSSSEGGGSGDP